MESKKRFIFHAQLIGNVTGTVEAQSVEKAKKMIAQGDYDYLDDIEPQEVKDIWGVELANGE